MKYDSHRIILARIKVDSHKESAGLSKNIFNCPFDDISVVNLFKKIKHTTTVSGPWSGPNHHIHSINRFYVAGTFNLKFKVGVNPGILENKERRNFWTITVMYIQEYIFEMSLRIYFWYQISLKILFFLTKGQKWPLV